MNIIFKYKKQLLLIIGALLIITFGLSYAYFGDLIGPGATTNVNIASDEQTSLTFTKGDDISFRVNPNTLPEGGNNLTSSTISSAKLIAGDHETGAVTENYNVYFQIKNNTFIYTSPTNEAEILLSITDPTGAKVVISGLTEKTSGGVTGYDITTFNGLLQIKELEEITTETTITEEWTATITFANLPTDQKDNMSKSLEATFVLQKEGLTSAEIILGHNGGKDFIEAKTEPDFTQIADTNEGMFATTDTYGTAYYYRGAVDNNWLYFNGIYWRIVSIAGNGSIKLLYSGTTAPIESEAVVMTGEKTTIGEEKFNTDPLDNASVGYMYTLGERQGLSESSIIKTTLETWYTTNMGEVDSQIADNVFCYDRSLAQAGFQSANYGSENGSYTGTGIGTSLTLYGVVERITASSSDFIRGGTGPSLMCPNKNDSYTVNDIINGNGSLSNKVGLLTTDEVVMASIINGYPNTSNYLYTNDRYWLGSPFGFSASMVAFTWIVNDRDLYIEVPASGNIGIRPVIYLSPEVNITGTGHWNDPYQVS